MFIMLEKIVFLLYYVVCYSFKYAILYNNRLLIMLSVIRLNGGHFITHNLLIAWVYMFSFQKSLGTLSGLHEAGLARYY